MKFAKIVGSAEIHVKVGSTIALTCVVNHQVPSIQWWVPHLLLQYLLILSANFHTTWLLFPVCIHSILRCQSNSTSTRLNSTQFENATQKRFHNHNPIEFNSNRGGINLETEKTHDGTTSRLLLTRAQFRDGGNYTCMPHGAIPASGFVHVLNGENSFLYSRCCWKHSNLMTLNAISFPSLLPFYTF